MIKNLHCLTHLKHMLTNTKNNAFTKEKDSFAFYDKHSGWSPIEVRTILLRDREKQLTQTITRCRHVSFCFQSCETTNGLIV